MESQRFYDSSETESEVEFSRFRKRKQRTPKSFNRNALMARENRLKKKQYMENLERELSKERLKCKRYSTLLKEQAATMDKQERDIKYLKSILANNDDICKLLRGIHTATGMPVGTSLNNNFTVSANAPAVATSPANVVVKTLHPWSDSHFSLGGLSDDVGFDQFLNLPVDNLLPDDHNYTQTSDEAETFGVCLHISNHKLSLEYCAQCHDNSTNAWTANDEAAL